MAGYIGSRAVALSTTAADVAGDIVVSGVVDGRDLAADGSKLDGIEASADVTDSANVDPLVDTHLNVSGATSGQYLGWNGSDYAWSTVDLSTKLDLSGGTLTGGLTGTTATFSGTCYANNTQLDLTPTNSDSPIAVKIVNNASGAGTGGRVVMGAGSGSLSQTAGVSGFYDGTGTSLAFYTSGSYGSSNQTEKARIDRSGNLLVGTTSSSTTTQGARLKPSGRGDFTADGGTCSIMNRLTSDGQILTFQKGGTEVGAVTTYNNTVQYGGALGSALYLDTTAYLPANAGGRTHNTIDLGNGTYKYKDAYFNGTVNAANFNTTSDATLKTNVETLTGSLDAVKAMRGVSFDWIESGNSEVGVIAQEVEAVVPDVVSTDDQGIKSVKYGNLVGVLIEAIKEQQQRIEALEAKLNS